MALLVLVQILLLLIVSSLEPIRNTLLHPLQRTQCDEMLVAMVRAAAVG